MIQWLNQPRSPRNIRMVERRNGRNYNECTFSFRSFIAKLTPLRGNLPSGRLARSTSTRHPSRLEIKTHRDGILRALDNKSIMP